jgi:hypothetical protein
MGPPAVPQDQANHVATITPSAIVFPQPNGAAAFHPHHAHAVLHPETYCALSTDPSTSPTWVRSYANKLGRLAQGVGNREKATDTIFFIPFQDVPGDRTVTYGHIVCDYRPQKDERLTSPRPNW